MAGDGRRAGTASGSAFDLATGVRGGPERWAAEVDPGWTVAGRPNGGYLLALVTRAALEVDGPARPARRERSLPGPRRPRARPRWRCAGCGPGAACPRLGPPCSRRARRGWRRWSPPGGSTRTRRPGGGGRPGRPGCRRWTSACPANRRCPVACGPTCSTISTCGWTRPPPGGSSAVPAGGWRCGGGCGSPTGAPPTRWPCSRWSTRCPRPASSSAWPSWSPTVELTVYLRGVPAPGWLAVVVRGQLWQGGWFDEDAEVWDSAGRLVAQSRQFAGLSPARPAGDDEPQP